MWRNFVVDPPEDTLIRKINYDENPFLSDTMLKVIDAARRRDPEGFVHVYEGVPESDDDAAIIKLSWIEAAVDAHKVLDFGPEGRKRIGFDVADSGADKCANVHRYGSVIYWADEWKAKEDELLKSCQRTYRGCNGARCRYRLRLNRCWRVGGRKVRKLTMTGSVRTHTRDV